MVATHSAAGRLTPSLSRESQPICGGYATEGSTLVRVPRWVASRVSDQLPYRRLSVSVSGMPLDGSPPEGEPLGCRDRMAAERREDGFSGQLNVIAAS
jgi:hypothetical protein